MSVMELHTSSVFHVCLVCFMYGYHGFLHMSSVFHVCLSWNCIRLLCVSCMYIYPGTADVSCVSCMSVMEPQMSREFSCMSRKFRGMVWIMSVMELQMSSVFHVYHRTTGVRCCSCVTELHGSCVAPVSRNYKGSCVSGNSRGPVWFLCHGTTWVMCGSCVTELQGSGVVNVSRNYKG
jgi:hypothetical protein